MDLADLVSLIRERREALGSSQSELARFSGLSRRMLASLETGVPSDVGVSRVPSLLSVLGLDLHLDPPSQAVRTRKRGLWMAGFVVGIGSDQGQDRPGLDVQPVAALPERVARVQGPGQLLEVDGQRPCGIATAAGRGAVRAHLDIPKASHKNW